ncbi:phage tail protein [Shewanella algae]|uniref:phage tail protein n=1 Tax=Shewanella algae TaxID=38313 RepID=UPI00313B35D2
MTETFIWTVNVGATGETTHKVLKNEFGDGYTQAFGVGINNRSTSWSVSVSGFVDGIRTPNIKPVLDFLKARHGYQSFYWTTPDGDTGLFRAENYSTANDSQNGKTTINWTMQETFQP